MSIKRIFVFSFLLVLSKIFFGFIGGEIPGMSTISGYFLTCALDFILTVALFAVYARVEVRLVYVRAFAILVVYQVVDLCIFYAIGSDGDDYPLWWIDMIILISGYLLGCELGRRTRRTICENHK